MILPNRQSIKIYIYIFLYMIHVVLFMQKITILRNIVVKNLYEKLKYHIL